MKLKVTQNLEQGMERRDGGALRLYPGAYEAERTRDGVLLIKVGSKTRSVPEPILRKLLAAGCELT